MRILLKLPAIMVLAGMSRLVLAQPVFGYNVNWGVQSVLINPLLSVVIGLLLLLASYAFLRRSSGHGIFMLAIAAGAGALSMHANERADAVTLAFYSITTPIGSHFFDCQVPSYSGYQNNTGSPIRLTLTLVGGAPVSAPLDAASPSGGVPACHAGDQELPSGGACYMPRGAT